MVALRLSRVAMALFASGVPAMAQTNVPAPSAENGRADCDTRAALYATEKGFKLWVTRRGTMVEDNPLRPLSRESKLVLEVAVNGRIATANGTDFANLHRSGPPRDLEEASVGPIRWERAVNGMPATIRVVAEDGSVVLGPLRFAECGDAPKIAPAAAKRPPKKAAPKPARGTAGEAPPGLMLPQGAIPE